MDLQITVYVHNIYVSRLFIGLIPSLVSLFLRARNKGDTIGVVHRVDHTLPFPRSLPLGM